ncbi:MAG: class I SAM-dependent methyltransferase, partial [Methylomonas sp.]
MTELSEKLAVVVADESTAPASHALAERLDVPLLELQGLSAEEKRAFFLCYRDGCLKLLDKQTLKKGGLAVEIDPRPGE